MTPAFSLLNVSADWQAIMGSRIDASLFVTNAQDKVYIAGNRPFYTNLGLSGQFYGEPRMYGVRVKYRFGAM